MFEKYDEIINKYWKCMKIIFAYYIVVCLYLTEANNWSMDKNLFDKLLKYLLYAFITTGLYFGMKYMKVQFRLNLIRMVLELIIKLPFCIIIGFFSPIIVLYCIVRKKYISTKMYAEKG